MAAIKGNRVDRYLAEPRPQHRAFLIYGPDSGLVAERADSLLQKASSAEPGGINVIRLDSEALKSNPGLLADEAKSSSLFGGAPLLRVTLADARQNLVPQIQHLIESPIESFWLVVQAGELRPTSPLRKLFEASDNAAAIPCYRSTAEDLANLAIAMAAESAVTLDDAAIRLIAESLGADRLAARREIEKLILYAGQNGHITASDVRAAMGENVTVRNDRIIDRALLGQSALVAADLRRLAQEQASATGLASQGLRYLIDLQRMREHVDDGARASDVVARARPPIFFDRKPSVEQALRLWSVPALRSARSWLAAGIRGARGHADLEVAHVAQALLRISVKADQLANAPRRSSNP